VNSTFEALSVLKLARRLIGRPAAPHENHGALSGRGDTKGDRSHRTQEREKLAHRAFLEFMREIENALRHANISRRAHSPLSRPNRNRTLHSPIRFVGSRILTSPISVFPVPGWGEGFVCTRIQPPTNHLDCWPFDHEALPADIVVRMHSNVRRDPKLLVSLIM
jgi:hypothetical protein